MNQKITLLILFAVPLFCMAQSQLARQYTYDAAGNRTACAVITLPPQAPPVPLDSTKTEELQVTSDERDGRDTLHVTRDNRDERDGKYFVEKIAQTEIKIYPNPTTEKITLEFSESVGFENFRTLRLYSLSGQLLQEQTVHSSTTVISLAGMPAGVYMLKVRINDSVEDWKVIKQ